MKRFFKFLRRSSEDKVLLLRITFWLWTIRLGLWLLPFQTLCRRLNRYVLDNDLQATDTESVRKVVWGVREASRYVPAATCLTQALVTWIFLRQLGQSSDLRIGVTKDLQGQLEAHAWVQVGGKIIIGKQPNHARYTTLPPLEDLVL